MTVERIWQRTNGSRGLSGTLIFLSNYVEEMR